MVAQLKSILEQYPDIFHGKLLDENLLMNMYGHVCTRCHGLGENQTVIAPMADNINHNNDIVYFECMNIGLQINPESDPMYLNYNRKVNDYSTLFKARGWSKE